MEWKDSPSFLRGGIIGALIGVVLMMFTGVSYFFILIVGVMFAFFGAVFGWAIGTYKHNNETIVPMEEQASYEWKQAIFITFSFPLGILLMFILAIILIVGGAFFVCSVWDNPGIEIGSGSNVLAVCGETFIPVLVWPAPWLFLICVILVGILLVKEYKQIGEEIMTKKSAITKITIGLFLWLLDLIVGYFFIFGSF